MAKAQLEPDPNASVPTQLSPGWRDLGWLSLYCMRGIAELAWARLVFARMPASDIPMRNAKQGRDRQSLNATDQKRVDRVAYVIPRLGERMPWRSDCVPQALAAQRWLGSASIASAIRIGVERPDDGDFGAHAWLVVGERIVTGGRVEQYQLLLDESEKSR
ncbi:MAG: lasso peptide biosynthesis B2 protein [Erythrobacter sp.]